MNLEEFYMISQVVAAFAVVASLVFVGLQMRQSDRTQIALMHGARTQRTIDTARGFMEPHTVEIFYKGRMDPQSLTAAERSILQFEQRTGLISTEDVIWQHKRGLLEDNVLEDQRQAVTRIMFSPAHRAIWKLVRSTYSTELVAFVDEIVRTAPLSGSDVQEDARWIEALELVQKEAAT